MLKIFDQIATSCHHPTFFKLIESSICFIELTSSLTHKPIASSVRKPPDGRGNHLQQHEIIQTVGETFQHYGEHIPTVGETF